MECKHILSDLSIAAINMEPIPGNDEVVKLLVVFRCNRCGEMIEHNGIARMPEIIKQSVNKSKQESESNKDSDFMNINVRSKILH